MYGKASIIGPLITVYFRTSFCIHVENSFSFFPCSLGINFFLFFLLFIAVANAREILELHLSNPFLVFLSLKCIIRNMQKEANVLFSLKQNVMLIDWHMPWQETTDVRLCMVISLKVRGKGLLQASEMDISIF